MRLDREGLVIGFSDEIYDVRPFAADGGGGAGAGVADWRFVMATNSAAAQVVRVGASHADLLSGHSHIVVAVDVTADGRFIVTASKDHTLRVWARTAADTDADADGAVAMDVDADDSKGTFSADRGGWQCVGICEGHSDAVGAVRFLRATPVSLLRVRWACECDAPS
jgi:U3 small nucleolar RNA-associated protein 13